MEQTEDLVYPMLTSQRVKETQRNRKGGRDTTAVSALRIILWTQYNITSNMLYLITPNTESNLDNNV